MKNPHKRFLIVVIFLALILAGIAYGWISLNYFPEQTALQVARASSFVEIKESSNRIEITPSDLDADIPGIIFYPGGFVAPESYIYKLSQLAMAAKARVFILKAPLNLAVLDINAAGRVIEEYPTTNEWIVGGHSLGGAMACRFAAAESAKVVGIFLFASYCDQDVSDANFAALVVTGSADLVLNREVWQSAQVNLPEEVQKWSRSRG